MHYSKLFGKTSRTASAKISPRGYELLFRAGFVRESSSGRYYMLPLGMRVQDRLCRIVEEEMSSVGAQKVSAPTLHPIELWRETSRDRAASFELTKVTDRRGAEFVLGGTAEEMMVDLVRRFGMTYRDLPIDIYQFSQKFRDELRARGGLLRAREFLMKDAYSFHTDAEDFAVHYEAMKAAYLRIFSRAGLSARVVAADNGYMGGEQSHELIVDCEAGESRYFVCDGSEEAFHEDVARFDRGQMNPDEPLLPMEVRPAARGVTIEAGVEFYGMPAWRQIKSIVYVDDRGEPLLVSLRGDLEVCEAKLSKASGCHGLRIADPETVGRLGSVVGFVSPLSLPIRKIGDESLLTVRNFYTGADRLEMDTLNVNYGRDFEVDAVADIALAKAGHNLRGSRLAERRGIEVGNIFQLGTYYSDRMRDACFIDAAGATRPFYMGCYGIGIGRTIAAIAELNSDERGLVWPDAVAPFSVHLVSLHKTADERDTAERLYEALMEAGVDVLFDERDASAGVKLNDADLIGLPLRLVVSSRGLSDGTAELKRRSGGELERISLDRVVDEVRDRICGNGRGKAL